ncbi:MAG: hypothetical protein RPU13_13470 [Candidatus Sedimenticola sp. (ex Thyasira tokunagai)]
MKRKIVVKRLSASDLTLFEHHFRNTSGTKQKAFNLDAAIFVKELYPGLPERMEIDSDRLPLDLLIYGPGMAGLHNLQRKILKQQKNWRLNGELIVDPPEEADRYNQLTRGDFAIMEFLGVTEPKSARIYLVAKANVSDQDLHRVLADKFGPAFNPHRGMTPTSPDEISEVISAVTLNDNHPILDFLEYDSLEDAVQGGVDGTNKLLRRRRTRGIGKEEFAQAKRNAELAGKTGEELVNYFLESKCENGEIPGYKWDADSNPISPFDFSIRDGETVHRKIDAKATSGSFENRIHVSMSELLEMLDPEIPYDIFRVYHAMSSGPKLRIAVDVREFAARIVDSLRDLPTGVSIDSVSIKPTELGFGPELELSSEEESE